MPSRQGFSSCARRRAIRKGMVTPRHPYTDRRVARCGRRDPRAHDVVTQHVVSSRCRLGFGRKLVDRFPARRRCVDRQPGRERDATCGSRCVRPGLVAGRAKDRRRPKRRKRSRPRDDSRHERRRQPPASLKAQTVPDFAPTWSPDGTQLAFSANLLPWKIHVMYADGAKRRNLTPGIWPVWSPARR